MKFFTMGDKALSVQLGDEISLEVNTRVRKLHQILIKNPIMGIKEVVPSYSTLMICYDPMVIGYKELTKALAERIDEDDNEENCVQTVKEIPILYGTELGPDLEECARLQNVSIDEVIRMHSSHEYYVHMLGFAPGHAYTARFEEPFSFKRRESPRISIPANSVVVQENLSNLIPFAQPCGWNIIGSTPLDICNYAKEESFLVKAGDWIRYVPIDKQQYDKIKKEVAEGTYICATYEKVVL